MSETTAVALAPIICLLRLSVKTAEVHHDRQRAK